jgi:hypothetical protein
VLVCLSHYPFVPLGNADFNPLLMIIYIAFCAQQCCNLRSLRLQEVGGPDDQLGGDCREFRAKL